MKKIILLSLLLIFVLTGINKTLGQSAIIKGKIADTETLETLVGVNIVEIDKNNRFISGTVSDFNGNYVFKVSDVSNIVQVSFIGYTKQTFLLEGRTQIDINLEPESFSIDEITVVGAKMGNDGVTSVRDRGTAVTRLGLEGMKSIMSTSV